MSWFGLAFACAAGVMLCANLSRVLHRDKPPKIWVVVVMTAFMLLSIIFLFKGE